jgi:hypothetical protein
MSSRFPHTRFRRPGAWRFALVLLGLLALGAQQLVAQTHWHALVAQAGADQPVPGDGHVRDADCLLCQIAAHAAAAAPPSVAPRLIPVAALHFVALPVRHETAFIPPPAHAWQSRGPPAA